MAHAADMSTIRRRSLPFLLGIAALLVGGLVPAGAAAGGRNTGHLEVVRQFNSSADELPEGIALDKAGNIYVSFGTPGAELGAIWRISPDGTETILHEPAFAPAGLAIDAPGNLYYAYPSFDPTQGVYRLTPGGEPEQLPGTENILLANGVALDKRGDLYVSDSILGAIWRIPRGGVAELWLQDESLVGCGNVPDFPPVGANGVAYRHKHLWVANTEQGLLIRIPIANDGSPGDPEIIAGSPECDPELDELDSIDGIALDVHGEIYAVLVLQDKLVRIDQASGTVTELVDGGGLHNPASLAFGTGRGDRQALFITNFALLPRDPLHNSFGPAVLKLEVGQPGMPLP